MITLNGSMKKLIELGYKFNPAKLEIEKRGPMIILRWDSRIVKVIKADLWDSL